MHLVLMVIAVVCVLGGFVGLALGVIPTIILWTLAALCILGAWKTRPASQRRREDRMQKS